MSRSRTLFAPILVIFRFPGPISRRPHPRIFVIASSNVIQHSSLLQPLLVGLGQFVIFCEFDLFHHNLQSPFVQVLYVSRRRFLLLGLPLFALFLAFSPFALPPLAFPVIVIEFIPIFAIFVFVSGPTVPRFSLLRVLVVIPRDPARSPAYVRVRVVVLDRFGAVDPFGVVVVVRIYQVLKVERRGGFSWKR